MRTEPGRPTTAQHVRTGDGRPRTVPVTGRSTAPPSRTIQPPRAKARSGLSLLWLPFRWTGRLVAVIAPLVLLAAGLVYVKLLFGAVPLHILVDPIRQALAAELEGIEVTVGDAALHRNDRGGIELRLKDLALAPAHGQSGLAAAEAVVGLDFHALWSGRIAASRIVLDGPRFELTYADDDAPASQQPEAALRSPSSGSRPSPEADRRDATVEKSRPAGRAVVEKAQASQVWKTLADVMARLGRRGEVASHLKSFGLRNAVLEVERSGRRALWAVPELEINLEHLQKRSVLTGGGRIAVEGEAFDVSFRLTGSGKSKPLKIEAQVEGLRPSQLARNLPHLGLFTAFDVEITGRGEMQLSAAGEVVDGRFDVDLARGGLLATQLGGAALGVDGGKITLHYFGARNQFEIAPSTLQIEGCWVRVKGGILPIAAAGGGESGWQLELNAIDGAIAAARDVKPMPIERMALKAQLWPATGASEIVSLVFKAGPAELEARGRVTGGEGQMTRLEGRIGALDLVTVKELWPAAYEPRMRAAVTRALIKGQLRGGTFQLAGATLATSQLIMSLEGEELEIAGHDGLPPVLVPRVSLTRSGDVVDIAIPDAVVSASAGRRLALKGGSIVITGLKPGAQPQVETAGRAQTSLAALLDLAGRDAVGLVKPGQIPAGADGKIEAQWRATFPLAESIVIGDLKLDARARLTDGRVPNVFGPHDVTGASFTVGASGRTIDIKGDLLLAGVAAKVSGQWLLGEAPERQSPITITTRLDANDRRQLGLTINDVVTGEVPLEAQVIAVEGEGPKVQVSADLTAAELIFDGLAWKKPTGRPARLSFDVVRPKTSKLLELQGFRIAGESIAIDGTVVIGPDGEPQSYKFPGFSLNTVSNLEVEGTRRPDKVWDVVARGKTFDGTDIMRALYAVDTPKAPKSTRSMAIDAHIDTVIGHNDTTVKQVHLRMRRNGDQLVALEFDGVLDTGQAIEAHIRPGQGRVIHVNSPDAGQALRTIGFYTSMVGGKGELVVNLDGRGGAERSGQIHVSRFRILGDPIVSELVQTSSESGPAIATGRRRAPRQIVREEIAFDTLRGSFSTGNGQVAIESLNAAGPLIGASVRGMMDFRTRSLSLGGTYVPLSGLNRALAGIPLVGGILTGPKGDGIIGITFAVDGSMEKPNVIINPLSMVAPGLFREIFQMAPENPRVTPAETGNPNGRGRPSAWPETKAAPARSGARVLDGWSAERPPSGRP